MRKNHWVSKLASKPTAVDIVQSVLHSSWHAPLWGTLSALNFRRCRNYFESSFISTKTFGQNLVKRTENFRLQNECNHLHSFLCLASIGMPYMEYWVRKVRQSNIYPLKKSGFQIVSARNSWAKQFRPSKFSDRSVTTLLMQLSKEANRSYNCVSGKKRQT